MKKLISSALALAMSISAFAPCVFAEDDMEKMIADVKNRAGITNEYTDFSSNYTSETDEFTEYNFSWKTEDDDKYVSVSYNSDDIITSYNEYHEYDYGSGLSLPKISADEAKKTAQEFIDKLNPSAKGEYVVSDERIGSALEGNYSFSIDRLKNGVPVNGFYGNIEVDRTDADVYSMWLSYLPIDEFEDITNTVSAEDAKAAFKEKLGLELVYNMYYDDKTVVFPVYTEKESGQYISAVTGEVYEPEIQAQLYRSADMAYGSAAAESSKADYGLSQAEIDELEKIAGLISKSDIEAKVRANKTLNIPGDLKLTSINLQRDYYDDTQYTYSMYFSGEKVYAGVSADAKTGEIKSFNYNNWSDTSEEEKALEEDEVKTAAEKVFNELAGGKKSEYRFDKVFGNNALYVRYVNDIKVQNDTINIGFDDDGRLISYYSRYTANAEFPSIDGVMSAEEAADKLFDAVSYDISYYPVTDENENTVAKALYMLDKHGFINPFTGELVNYRNEKYEDNETYSYGDIENHYAKNQIETLASYGIGFSGGEYKPNETITQRDFLYLLLRASYSYNYFNDDDELYNTAKRKGLIDERNDNAEVTRGEMAKIMIRFMGAEEFAKYDDIYVSPFKDVTEDKGYAAILSAMKIVKGDESGCFNPDNSMTRAEAACVIYNYLNR